MMAEDFACNARNLYPGTVYNNGNQDIDVYGKSCKFRARRAPLCTVLLWFHI